MKKATTNKKGRKQETRRNTIRKWKMITVKKRKSH